MKPKDITESEWQKQVIEMAHLFGWTVAHFRVARTNKGWRTPVGADGEGFPDLVLVRERIIFAELKRRLGKLSEPQERWRDALLAAGAEWYEWRPQDFDTIAEVLR